MKYSNWIFLLLLVGCSGSHTLTIPMAQNALDRMIAEGRFAGGTATITKVDEVPKENKAKAAITFSELAFTGVMDEFPQRYSGAGEATFVNSDGTWVLTKVSTAGDLSWEGLSFEAH